MPNIAAVLKEEIRRLAKREIKANTTSMKTAVTQLRRDVARLKREVLAGRKQIASLKSQETKRTGKPEAEGKEELEGVRHSCRSVRSQRKRLKLSAAEFGKLLGVSQLTVYNWEHGKSRPTKSRLAALVAIRKMGRRETVAKLATLSGKAAE